MKHNLYAIPQAQSADMATLGLRDEKHFCLLNYVGRQTCLVHHGNSC